MNSNRRIFVRLSVVLVATLLSAGHVWAADRTLPGEKEWMRTVAAAKKEGKLTIYGNPGADLHFREFQKKYPEIKVNTVIGYGSLIAPRLLTERRAGKHLVDIYTGGTNTLYKVVYRGKALQPLRPVLLLPEVLDQSKWWRGKHHYVDSEAQSIFIFEGTVQSGRVGYNNKIVDPKEIRSYWDLLNSKWKGKIISADPMRGGISTQSLRFFYHNPDLGPDFIWRLFTEMDITISRNPRQVVDWLGRGKYSISLFVNVFRGAHQGLPVSEMRAIAFKEGGFVDPTVGAVGLIRQAPHPNAAKVAINWLLSREGQIAFQKTLNNIGVVRESMREDIPKDIIPSADRRIKGHEYLFTNRSEWIEMTQILNHVRKALQQAKKK